MTKQQIYDKVIEHLFQQALRCTNPEGACAYRWGDNMCSIGALLDDDTYRSEWEGKIVDEIFSELPEHLKAAGKQLLDDLQTLHDLHMPAGRKMEDWPEVVLEEFKNFARSIARHHKLVPHWRLA